MVVWTLAIWSRKGLRISWPHMYSVQQKEIGQSRPPAVSKNHKIVALMYPTRQFTRKYRIFNSQVKYFFVVLLRLDRHISIDWSSCDQSIKTDLMFYCKVLRCTFWGGWKNSCSANSCNLSYLIRQRQEHQKMCTLSFSLHKFVHIKFFRPYSKTCIVKVRAA